MADNSQSEKIAYNGGEVQGQATEKASTMMDKASNAAQSAKDSMSQAGEQMKAKAQGTVDAVRNATGMNK